MKLRNKKTGEVVDLSIFGIALSIRKTEQPRAYYSIAELNEEWEDYESAEPLIDDGRVRKTVRAWAEANNYGKDEEYQFEEFSTGWKSWSLTHQNGDDNEIHFNSGIDFGKMNHQGYYTITELCGEEEE